MVISPASFSSSSCMRRQGTHNASPITFNRFCAKNRTSNRRQPSAAVQAAAGGERSQPSTGSAAAAASVSEEPIEAIIADVLNANNSRARLQRPSDLLSLLDSTGNGLSTVVRRSWDSTAVGLSLERTWAQCAEARKMAMLAAYQERMVSRGGALLRLLRWVEQQQPELLDAAVVQQVDAAAAAGAINPAVQVLMVPQLTLLAAGLVRWPVLLQLVEAAVAAATQTLLSKPPYSYSPAKRKAAQQQLQWVEASLCRGAALARLRALLLQQGRLQHWQQQADAAAAAAGGTALQGLTAEQAYHEWWKQQQQQQQYAGSSTLGSATAGRPLQASFHSHGGSSSSGKQWQQQAAPGTAATAAGAGSSTGGWDVAAVAVEQQQVCCSITQLTERVRALKQQMGATEAAVGVLPEVQNAHRSALLDLLVAWAEASPATQGPGDGASIQARVAISSLEHDRLLRRIAVEASGPEATVLRRLAASKGRGFLAHFSPTVGNPFGGTQEWDYFRDCPGVFARFVVDPPTTTATLTFKQQQQGLSPAAPSAAAADVQVVLSGQELQQLQQQLLRVLSGSSSAASSSTSSNGSRTVQLRPLNGSSSSSTAVARGSSGVRRSGAAAAAGGLELLLDGAAAAVLLPAHVVSLVTVFDDLGGQLPQQYSTSRQLQEVQVTPAPGWAASLHSAAAAVQSAARAAAAAALLALPLIAMARPFRAQQLLPAAATAATHVDATAATAAAAATAAVPAAAASRGVLLNDRLSSQELQQLCTAVQQRLEGQVWLSSTEAQVDDATAASILGSSGSSSGAAAAASILNSSSSSSGGSSSGLVYQVAVDGNGRVLGVSPCCPAAAAAVWELPLLVDLKGSKLGKVQERRAKAIAEAVNPSAAKPPKHAPPSSSSRISYSPAQQHSIPPEGVAVLKLQLQPAAVQQAASAAAAADGAGSAGVQSPDAAGAAVADESSSRGSDPATQQGGSGPQQQQQQQQQLWQNAVVVFGSGKGQSVLWLMQAAVTPWSDDDSLAVWASRGAVIQQQQQQQQVAAGSSADAAAAGGGGSSGLSLSVDGQEVASMEAFVQQLIALSQQAQQQQQQQ